MPTIVTRYVDTRSPSGGNGTTPSTGSGDANRAYPNLSASLAAESASRADLVARDEILKIECAGTLDTSSLQSIHVPRFITDYDRYLWITANSESKHQGVWDVTKYTIASSGNTTGVILLDNINVLKLEGLQIENISTNNVGSIITISNPFVTNNRQLSIVDCHLRGVSGSEGNKSGISMPFSLRKSLVMVNSIIHGNFNYGIFMEGISSGSLPSIIYNNTIFGARTGSSFNFANANASHSMYNNIMTVVSGGIAYVTGSMAKSFGNNISSDNSSPQPALRNITIQFANTSSGDFRLVDRSSPAVNTGTNLSNDILYPFNTDVAGNIRGTGRGGRAWDIGALEYQRPPNVINTTIGKQFVISPTGSRGRVIGSTTWG